MTGKMIGFCVAMAESFKTVSFICSVNIDLEFAMFQTHLERLGMHHGIKREELPSFRETS